MALRDACASKNCSPFAPDEFWPAPPPDAGNICSFVWWREHHRTALSAFSRWSSVYHPLQCTDEVESAGPATIVRNPSRCYCVRKSTLSLFTHIMFRKLQQLNSKTITRTYDHIHYRFAFTIGVIVTSHCHLKLQLWWSIWLINVTPHPTFADRGVNMLILTSVLFQLCLYSIKKYRYSIKSIKTR